jgi:hypothetical protein
MEDDHDEEYIVRGKQRLLNEIQGLGVPPLDGSPFIKGESCNCTSGRVPPGRHVNLSAALPPRVPLPSFNGLSRAHQCCIVAFSVIARGAVSLHFRFAQTRCVKS